MNKIYVCQVCGHIEFGAAPETCPVCWAEKEKFENNDNAIHSAAHEGNEKHVPVLAKSDTCGLIPDVCKDLHVKVGSVPHPMEADHFIEWIDVYLDHVFISRAQLTPAALQAAVGLHLKKDQQGTITAIGHCNKHGYWTADLGL